MPLDRQAVLDRLRAFGCSGRFTQELGWDWYTAETKITVALAELIPILFVSTVRATPLERTSISAHKAG
jgi:hypothetical protein